MRAFDKNKSGEARVFFALWPKASTQKALQALTIEYRPKCKARAVKAAHQHMTLQFIEKVARNRLPQLIQAAGNISAPAFGFTLDQLTFWSRSQIACVTMSEKAPALNQLVNALKQQLTQANIVFKDQAFVPHVTLLRKVENRLAKQTIQPIDWWADAFVLVESTLTRHGPHYQILHQWPLPQVSKTNTKPPQ